MIDQASGRARRLVATGALVFAAAAPLTYALLRIAERVRGPTVDPSLIVHEARIGFVWRCLAAAWWAGLCAIVAVAAVQSRREDSPIPRWLGIAVAAAAAMAGLLAWRFP